MRVSESTTRGGINAFTLEPPGLASRTSTSDLALFRAQWRTCLLRRVAFHVKLALFFGHFWVKLLVLNNLLALFPLKFALFYAFSCPAGRI